MNDPIQFMPLPAVDEHGTPVAKMPTCPRCGEDELGMVLPPAGAFCYACGAQIVNENAPDDAIEKALLRLGPSNLGVIRDDDCGGVEGTRDHPSHE